MNVTSEAWGWRAYWPAISWNGIFAGWLFAWALAMLLYAFGAAVGITTMAAMHDFSRGVAAGTGIWVVLSWITGTFSGAWLAARLAGRPDQGVGAMHGMVVWALCGIMTLILGQVQAAGVAVAGKEAAKVTAPATQAVAVQQPAQPAAAADAGAPMERTDTEISQGEEPEPSGINADAQAIRQALIRFDEGDLDKMRLAIAGGRAEEARQLLAQNTDLNADQINQVIANLSEGIEQVEQPAAHTGDVTSGALWVVFLTSLFGLGAGIAGGMLGARRSEEFYAGLTASAPPAPQPEYAASHQEREEEAAERW